MILFHIVYVLKLAVSTNFNKQTKGILKHTIYFDLADISNTYINFLLTFIEESDMFCASTILSFCMP